MSRKTINLYVCDDVIQHCENILERNFAKFHNCAKLQEIFRSLFVSKNDEYQFLKTWLDRACADFITLKSKHGDLSRLYEVLLRNNFIKDFLEYVNDQETLQLKFIDTINQYTDLERMLNMANESFLSLKSERNDLILRNYDLLLKTDFAKELLDRNSNEQEILRLKFVEKVDECERISTYLDVANESMIVLNSQHGDLMQRYKVLSENNILKEFVEYAKHRETLRLKFTEKTDECSYSEAREMLITERLRRRKIENERDSLDYLSEELCRLLLRYQRPVSFDEGRKKFDPASEQMQSSATTDTDFTFSNYTNIIDDFGTSSSRETNNLHRRIDIKGFNLGHDFEPNHQVWLENDIDNEPITVKEEETDISLEKSEEHDSLTQFEICHATGKLLKTDQFEKTSENEYTFVVHSSSKKFDHSSLISGICEQQYSRKNSQNIYKYNGDGSEKGYKCTTCSKIFREIAYLKRHELMHSSKKLFQCTLCNKCFKDPSNKSRHERTVHGRGTRYYCAHCDENYARKGNLLIHIKTKHLPGSQNQFRCATCEKSFYSKESLKYHQKAHALDRPYKCSICCKRFKDGKTRGKHERKVHVESTRFYCAHCKKNYRYKYDLTRHMQRDHL